MKRIALVVGNAPSALREIEEAKKILPTGEYDVYAINDAAFLLNEKISVWYSNHMEASRWNMYLARAEELKKDITEIVTLKECDFSNRHCGSLRPKGVPSGSSGLTAVLLALKEGYERVLIAGISMAESRASTILDVEFPNPVTYTRYKEAWLMIAKRNHMGAQSNVRAMGGFPASLFGKPNAEWLGLNPTTKLEKPLYSFCTTCMGRKHHIEKTLPVNLAVACKHQAQIVLLDYNSNDNLAQYVKNEFSQYIESRHLLFARTTEPTRFKMSHAKNITHLLASGDILLNVDADNYIDSNYMQWLKKAFALGKNVFVHAGEAKNISGRIAVRKKHFLAVNGYAEDFDRSNGWGFDDTCFIRRLELLGLVRVTMPFVFRDSFISHSDEWRVKNHPNKDFKASRNINKEIFESRGDLTYINKNDTWGRAKVTVNFNSEISI